jgi:serralysin
VLLGVLVITLKSNIKKAEYCHCGGEGVGIDMVSAIENRDKWCFTWFEASQSQGANRAGLWLASRWTPGATIEISFLDGDPELHIRVEAAARQWIQPGRANLFFDFRKDTTDTPIRISFSLPGSWSVLGTTCHRIPKAEPTMNFGWLKPNSPVAVLERVVLHEFGHALGLVHEHQLPAGGIIWNRPAVYADLHPRWSHEKIEQNLFATIDPAEAAMTTLDPLSIMMYPIKKSWTYTGFSTGLNEKPSATDIAFIHNMY